MSQPAGWHNSGSTMTLQVFPWSVCTPTWPVNSVMQLPLSMMLIAVAALATAMMTRTAAHSAMNVAVVTTRQDGVRGNSITTF